MAKTEEYLIFFKVNNQYHFFYPNLAKIFLAKIGMRLDDKSDIL